MKFIAFVKLFLSFGILFHISGSGYLIYSSCLQSPASDASCVPVRSVLQEYEVILELYIALTYTVNDAVKLNDYYNSPA